MSAAYAKVLNRLAEITGYAPRGRDAEKMARCPAHDDRTASLSVGLGRDGEVLLDCKAGCETAAVLTAAKLDWSDLFEKPRERTDDGDSWMPCGHRKVDEYRYTDADGRLLFAVARCDRKGRGCQGFRQWRPDPSAKNGRRWSLDGVRRVPFELPLLLAAAQAGQRVFVVEGEKDVAAALRIGEVATCNPGGAGKWRDDYASHFTGCSEAVVVADRDDPGRKHAREVAESLTKAGVPVRVVEPKAGKDLSDHLASGHGIDGLVSVTAGAAEAENDRPARRIRLTPASTIPMRPVRWLWDTAPADAPPSDRHGRLPEGSLCVGAGRAGLGKSQFGAWTTARMTTGTLPGMHWGEPRTVAYAAAEDSWAMTIAPRLHAAGANLDLVFRVDVESDGDPHARLTLPKDTALLEEALVSHGVALVVLDPLLSLIDGGINDYRAREVREALEPLAVIADRARATFLGIAHFTKASGTDPLMLISGSAAFGQVIRAAVGFARDEDDEGGGAYVLSTIKNNLGREDLPSLTYTIEPWAVDTPLGQTWVSRLSFTGEESQRSVRDILGDRGQDERTERDGAKDFLRGLLPAPAKTVQAQAREAGFSWATVRRAADDLGVRKVHPDIKGPWYWELPSPQGAHQEFQGAHMPGGEHLGPGGEHLEAEGEPEPPTANQDTADTRPSCRDCGKQYPAWILAKREGRCVGCHDAHARSDRPDEQEERP